MCIHGIGQLTVLIHGRGNESKEDLRIRYMKSRNKRIEFILHGELKVRIKSSQYFRKPAPGNRIDQPDTKVYIIILMCALITFLSSTFYTPHLCQACKIQALIRRTESSMIYNKYISTKSSINILTTMKATFAYNTRLQIARVNRDFLKQKRRNCRRLNNAICYEFILVLIVTEKVLCLLTLHTIFTRNMLQLYIYTFILVMPFITLRC